MMISLLSGKQPFEGIPMSDVMHNVCLQREHLDVPLNCPSELADALTQCWSYFPNDRPSFSYLVNIFKEHLNIVESDSEQASKDTSRGGSKLNPTWSDSTLIEYSDVLLHDLKN